MKTQQTRANLAIKALADSIAASVADMVTNAEQAHEAAQLGDLNMTVGCLMPIQQQLEAVQAQLAAVMALHRSK